MFLKHLDRDFTKDEIQNILNPHYKIVSKYLEEYVIPEVISFYIATGYYHSYVYEENFNIHIKSILGELFNYEVKYLYFIKRKVKSILKVKYNLKVISERPLRLVSTNM